LGIKVFSSSQNDPQTTCSFKIVFRPFMLA